MTRNARDQKPDGSVEPTQGPTGHADGSPERQSSLIEFAVILVLIAIVALVALVLLDDALADLMSLIGESVE